MPNSLPGHCSCAVATTAICAVHGLLGRRVIDPPIPLSLATKCEAVAVGAVEAERDRLRVDLERTLPDIVPPALKDDVRAALAFDEQVTP